LAAVAVPVVGSQLQSASQSAAAAEVMVFQPPVSFEMISSQTNGSQKESNSVASDGKEERD
jgi:hypothetical protein